MNSRYFSGWVDFDSQLAPLIFSCALANLGDCGAPHAGNPNSFTHVCESLASNVSLAPIHAVHRIPGQRVWVRSIATEKDAEKFRVILPSNHHHWQLYHSRMCDRLCDPELSWSGIGQCHHFRSDKEVDATSQRPAM